MMKKKWIRMLVLSLAFLVGGTLEFGAGYYMGQRNAAPVSKAESFFAGKSTFCELDEDDRLTVCPVVRKASRAPVGKGVAVLYICDSARKNGYIEVVGADAKFGELVNRKLLALARGGAKVEKTCAKKNSVVYRVSPR